MRANFTLKIMTPEKLVVDESVNSVILPGVDGILQVSAANESSTMPLRSGIVMWNGDGRTWIAAIEDGVAMFKNGVLRLVTPRCTLNPARPDWSELFEAGELQKMERYG